MFLPPVETKGDILMFFYSLLLENTALSPKYFDAFQVAATAQNLILRLLAPLTCPEPQNMLVCHFSHLSTSNLPFPFGKPQQERGIKCWATVLSEQSAVFPLAKDLGESHHVEIPHAPTPPSLLESLLAISPRDKKLDPCMPHTSHLQSPLTPINHSPLPISPRQDTQLRHRNKRKEDDGQSAVQKNKPRMRTVWEGRRRCLWSPSGTHLGAGTHTHMHTTLSHTEDAPHASETGPR